MDGFELPANIKQIGTIDKGLRIYVEDYVSAFIQQYTQAAGSNERLAFLIGRYLTIDSQNVLFISGAVEGKYCLEERGRMEFSDKSREYLLDTMDKYFSSLEVVGWVQSQPGYGTYLNSKYYNYHMENFKKDFQVLLVSDPIQKLSSFFSYNENNELAESSGYFIYYDKNKAMHEYMIDTKTQSFTIPPKINDSKDHEEEPTEPAKLSRATSRPVPLRAMHTDTPYGSRTRTAPATRGSKPAANDHRRIINMLTGLCAVMFLVSFIMGAGLLKSDERINMLEHNLSALNTAYRNLSSSDEQTVSTFSPQETPFQAQSALVVTEDGNQLLEAENAKAAEAAFAPAEIIEIPPLQNQLSHTEIPETYIVQQGDSLIGISQKFYGSKEMVEKIMEVNNISDPDKIFFGKILIMPKQSN